MTIGKKPKTESEILRPNFGQHTQAIEELRKLLSEATRYRDASQKRADDWRERLQEEERNVADRNRKIESYSGAIRALGGKVPDGPETA